jgi:hypothetical protein
LDQTQPKELAPAEPTRNRSPRWLKALQGAIAILSVIFILGSLAKDKDVFLQAKEIAWHDIAIIIGILLVYFVLHAYRFVLLIEHHCRCRIPLLEWIRMLVVVRLLNNLVPQMGTIHRGISLKRDFGVSYTDYIAANLFFIWTDTLLNFAIAFILFALGAAQLQLFGLSAGNFLGLSLIVIIIAPFLAQRVLGSFKKPLKIVQKLAEVADQLTRGLGNLRYMLTTTTIAVASFLIMTHVFRILLGAVGAEVDMATLAVFYALYRLTFHINITPGNVGVREIAYGLLCAQAHIGMSKGLLISAELRVLSMIVLVTVGVSVAGRQLVGAWRLARAARRGSSS